MPNKPFYTITKEKKIKLIKPALSEFLKNPFNKVTVSSLTETMGILRTDFYYYFLDKYDIYDLILDTVIKEISKDNPIHSLINVLFNKITSMTGSRNDKYLLDLSRSYNIESLDYFYNSLNKKLNREVSPKEYIDETSSLLRFIQIIKLYKENKISVDQASNLIK